MKRIILFNLIIIICSLSIYAQWTNDFNNPMIIDQCHVHIDPEVVFSDGYFTFTWAESTSNPAKKRKISIYDHKGFLVNFNSNPFSTEDYQTTNNSVSCRNLWPSPLGGSFLAQLMRKKNTNKNYVTVLRIDKDGSTTWSLKDDLYRIKSTALHHSLCVNENDEAFLAVQWESKIDNKVELTIYKINPAGGIEWSYRRMFHEDSTVGLSREINLIPTIEGGCFVAYFYINRQADESGYYFIDSYAIVNKLDREGNLEWDKPYILEHKRNGMMSLFVIGDEEDNLYCLWDGKIQKVHPDGYPLWQTGGIIVMERYNIREPILFETGIDGNIRVVYDNAWSDDRFQLFGQCISTDGKWLWGERGRKIIDNPYSFWGGNFTLGMSRDTILVAYKDIQDINQEIYRTEYQLFDSFGFKILNEPVKVYDHDGLSNFLVDVIEGVPGQFLLSWFSFDNPGSLLMAQSIGTDGSLDFMTSKPDINLAEEIPFIRYNEISQSLMFRDMPKELGYSLISISGQLVKSGFVKSEICVADISPGIYVLSVFNSTRRIQSKKILIASY